MKFILASVLLLLPFASVAQESQTPLPRDGTTWAKMDYLSKAFYVGGFRAGYMTGYLRAHGNAEKVEYSEAVPSARRTNADIEKQVDLFYSDYKNAPICIFDAVSFSIESLDGNAPTEKVLQTSRESGSKQGCAL